MFRALAGLQPSDAEIDGPALETLVLQELRAANDYQECGYRLHYWRTRAQMEVDFVLYGPRGLLAIEVKRSRQVHPADTRSLREFRKDYPSARCYVFHGGEQELHLEDIAAIPMEQALSNLGSILQGNWAIAA